MPHRGDVGALQSWRSRAGLFALFLLLNLWLAWPSLRWPMVYDDLHLIRPLERAELLAALHGDWDPDRIETEGFRPLTTLFNHARSVYLGENVLAHRLLILAMHALYLTLLVSLACRFVGTRPRAALAGGLFVLFSHLSVFHYVWLADGVHVLQGVFFALAGHLLLSSLATGRPSLLALSGVSVVAGSLVREDTLVVVPILFALGLFATEGPPGGEKLRRLTGYVLGVGVAALALMGIRWLIVPAAPPPSICLGGLLHRLARLLNPLGNDSYDGPSRIFSVSGWGIIAVIATALVIRRHEVRWQTPALWLGCAIVACSAATEFQRDNLLFFPLAFSSLALATALDELTTGLSQGRWLAAAGAAWLIVGGAYTSRLVAENFAPESTVAIAWNGQFVFGWARRAHIPEVRRAAVVERMAAIGIHNRRELRKRLFEIERESRVSGRRRPTDDGQVFYPLAALPRDQF